MKIGKLDLKQWKWRGTRMVKPHVLAWRCLWWLPVMMALCVLCLLVGIGFGPSAARDVWRDVAN